MAGSGGTDRVRGKIAKNPIPAKAGIRIVAFVRAGSDFHRPDFIETMANYPSPESPDSIPNTGSRVYRDSPARGEETKIGNGMSFPLP